MRFKFAVSLPVRNGENYLRAALESILGQGHEDFELVVADNASTDATPEIVRQFSRHDPRVRYLRHEDPLPLAENVNSAVAASSGDWIKLFCHDDLMAPNCLATIGAVIGDAERRGVGLIGNAESWLFANGEQLGSTAPSSSPVSFWDGKLYLRRYLRGNQVPPLPALTTATVRRTAWSQHGGFDARFAHCDVFLWTEVLTNWNYAYIQEPLTKNRIHALQVAVATRAANKSVQEHQMFWGEFSERYAQQLSLDRRARLRLKMRPLGVAATTIAVDIMTRRFRAAFRDTLDAPLSWWPILPLAVARSLHRERSRTAAIRRRVPASMIYPHPRGDGGTNK